MKQAITYQNIWRVAFPIILSSAAQNLVNAIDTAFMGRLGEQAIGATGNAIIFYYIFVVAAIGFSLGGEILIGRKNGEGKYAKVGKILDHCIYTFIPFSIILFIILRFISPGILAAVTKSPEIYELCTDFLSYRSFGIFFALANLVFRIFYVGITHTRILTTSTFFMAGINVVLDYVLIFGKFGFPAMGVKGAALASVIAEASTTIYFIVYTNRNKEFNKFQLFRFTPLKTERLKVLLKISSPTSIQSLLAIGSWLIFFLIIEKMGERELAISHMVRSIYMIMVIPMFGLSQSTTTLVSNVIGQGDIDHVLKLVKKSVMLSLGCSAIIFPVILLLSESILSIYTDDYQLISDALPVLRVVNVAMVFLSAAYTVFSAVSGTGRTVVSLLIEASTLVIYLTGAWKIAIHWQMALPVVWYSEFIYFGIMGLLSVLYLRFGGWRNVRI